MDPLTIAARGFLRAHETSWDPPPGAGERPRILRLEGAPEDRTDMIKALRLLEWQPDNRRPFVIVEAAFVTEATFVSAAIDQFAADVAAVDRGLAEDKVNRVHKLEAPVAKNTSGLVAFALRAAKHLADVLDGLVVVLAPKAVHDVPAFEAFARVLVGALPAGTALRIDILAPTVPKLAELLPVAAKFELDREALFEHLKELGPKPSQGPKDARAPELPAAQRARIERELGQPLVSIDAGRALKVLMMDGTRALSESRPKEAVRKLRAARMLCESSGLVREALLVTIGLGTAYVSAKNPRAAEACYEHARSQARERALLPLEIQALFGLGQLRIMHHRFAEARLAFERIAELEPATSPLQAEARRLVEACKQKNALFGLQSGGVA